MTWTEDCEDAARIQKADGWFVLARAFGKGSHPGSLRFPDASLAARERRVLSLNMPPRALNFEMRPRPGRQDSQRLRWPRAYREGDYPLCSQSYPDGRLEAWARPMTSEIVDTDERGGKGLARDIARAVPAP